MQIEEAIKRCNRRIKELKLYFAIDNLDLEAIETLLNYIEIMHKEFDRLEGIEDNTAMLKYELEKKDTVINEAISYIENTFELEDEKCITELYDILKKAEEK